MRLFHLFANVAPWGPHPSLALVDDILSTAGSIAFPLEWSSYTYEEDKVHFTRWSYLQFVAHLVSLLEQEKRWLILADSTVGWHDYDDAGNHTGWASELLKSFLAEGSVVDAVNGSGFVALRSQRHDFTTRLQQYDAHSFDNVLIIGGWNDVAKSTRVLEKALMQFSRHVTQT